MSIISGGSESWPAVLTCAGLLWGLMYVPVCTACTLALLPHVFIAFFAIDEGAIIIKITFLKLHKAWLQATDAPCIASE